MAQEVFVYLADDLDGSTADETIMFALDGAGYEIDLNTTNATALRKALDKYVVNGRKSPAPTGGRRGRPSARRGGGSAGPDPKAVRRAQDHGLEISTRGRVPAEIIDRYRAAGGT